jgi:ubiquinone/menaquinone biosynthesis C-methylase UbiE
VRELFEDIWEQLPARLEPPDWEPRHRFLLEHVAPGSRVLDLGCGEGRFTAALEAVGAEATGADVAEAALRRARKAHPGLRFERVPYDGPLPFPDAAFDVVWISEVIERVADAGRFLGQARRVLRPDGVVLLTTPSAGRLRTVIDGLPDPTSDRLHLYTRRSLENVLRDAGFGSVKVKRFGARRGRLSATARQNEGGRAGGGSLKG